MSEDSVKSRKKTSLRVGVTYKVSVYEKYVYLVYCKVREKLAPYSLLLIYIYIYIYKVCLEFLDCASLRGTRVFSGMQYLPLLAFLHEEMDSSIFFFFSTSFISILPYIEIPLLRPFDVIVFCWRIYNSQIMALSLTFDRVGFSRAKEMPIFMTMAFAIDRLYNRYTILKSSILNNYLMLNYKSWHFPFDQ